MIAHRQPKNSWDRPKPSSEEIHQSFPLGPEPTAETTLPLFPDLDEDLDGE